MRQLRKDTSPAEIVDPGASSSGSGALCTVCGKPFTPYRRTVRTCRDPECKLVYKRATGRRVTRAYRERHPELAPPRSATCLICAKPFAPYRRNQTACSKPCRKEHLRRTADAWRRANPEKSSESQARFQAKKKATREAAMSPEERQRRQRLRKQEADRKARKEERGGDAETRRFTIMASESKRRAGRKRVAAEPQNTAELPPPHKVLHGLWLYKCDEYDAHMTPAHCAFNRQAAQGKLSPDGAMISLGGGRSARPSHASLYGDELAARATSCKGCPGVVALARGEQRKPKPEWKDTSRRCKRCDMLIDTTGAQNRKYCSERCAVLGKGKSK